MVTLHDGHSDTGTDYISDRCIESSGNPFNDFEKPQLLHPWNSFNFESLQ